MAQFNFTTREDYLTFRADWRARYKVQVQLIRQTKRDLVGAHRSGNWTQASALQSRLHYQRRDANRLMLELAAAKEHKNNLLAAAETALAA